MVVHYRKIGVLRRLRATPLMPFAFHAAQVLSRLLVFLPGALYLISLGLIVSARLRTEELADGILNLLSWPMRLLSGIWFSLEGTSPAAQALSQVFPVTHLVAATRRIMIDGPGVLEVLPEIGLLAALALVLLALAARLFLWE